MEQLQESQVRLAVIQFQEHVQCLSEADAAEAHDGLVLAYASATVAQAHAACCMSSGQHDAAGVTLRQGIEALSCKLQTAGLNAKGQMLQHTWQCGGQCRGLAKHSRPSSLMIGGLWS